MCRPPAQAVLRGCGAHHASIRHAADLGRRQTGMLQVGVAVGHGPGGGGGVCNGAADEERGDDAARRGGAPSRGRARLCTSDESVSAIGPRGLLKDLHVWMDGRHIGRAVREVHESGPRLLLLCVTQAAGLRCTRVSLARPCCRRTATAGNTISCTSTPTQQRHDADQSREPPPTRHVGNRSAAPASPACATAIRQQRPRRVWRCCMHTGIAHRVPPSLPLLLPTQGLLPRSVLPCTNCRASAIWRMTLRGDPHSSSTVRQVTAVTLEKSSCQCYKVSVASRRPSVSSAPPPSAAATPAPLDRKTWTGLELIC